MSSEEKLGDTEYFASTDYNQRLEEKAESEYEQKTDVDEVQKIATVNNDIDTLIHERNINALYKLANEPLAESDAAKLAALGDKDIHIALARNESITDAVSSQLIGTVYMAHKELLSNPSVSSEVKTKLKEYLTGNAMYDDLLKGA